MAIQAILFDLDGTLLDTNMLHVESWRRGFEQFGHEVTPERIEPEIGRAGEEIVVSILGEDVEKSQGKAIRERVSNLVPVITEERKPLRVVDGARELFAALRERDLKAAIATAAGEKKLSALMSGSGLDVCELADVVTTKDDAEESKPAPDILLAACEKLQVQPEDALFVGDTKWDALSGRKAGVASIGVLECSAYNKEELLDAGMQQVFATLAELLENLDDVVSGRCEPRA